MLSANSNRLNARHEFSWRVLFKAAFTAAFVCLPWAASHAQPAVGGGQQATIADAEKLSLFAPSHLTPRALTGLFTSVARAGNRLVAVGERGRIIVSDDNGGSWRQIETPTSVTLTHVQFATPTDGWAVGNMGAVLHSTDGGLTWKMQLNGVQAINVALADAQADIKQRGTNDITTANLQSAQSMAGGGPSVPFLDVYAASASNVMVAGAFGMAFNSTDAGVTWHSLANLFPNPNGLHIYQIIGDNNNLAVVGEQGLALYGPPGKPLATITTPFQGTLFGEVFAPDHSWIIFGLEGTILRSPDQGKHWAAVTAGAPVGIDCGIVLSNGNVVLGNVAGQLLTSHDNGQSFTVSTVNEPIVGLAQAPNGAIIATGLLGTRTIPLNKLAAGA